MRFCVEAMAIASWLPDDGLQVRYGPFNRVTTDCKLSKRIDLFILDQSPPRWKGKKEESRKERYRSKMR